MHTIKVDDAVFSAIWAKWQEGDDENSILRRIFGLPETRASTAPGAGGGYIDPRSGTVFPKGFEVFRMRNGVRRSAIAQDGAWVLDDGQVAPTLNKLSDLIGALTESAWEGWYYTENGERKAIKEFRQKYRAQKQNKQ